MTYDRTKQTKIKQLSEEYVTTEFIFFWAVAQSLHDATFTAVKVAV
jgi:hypothetical protein